MAPVMAMVVGLVYDRTCLPKGKVIESIGTLVFVRVDL
jgi:hypothetical protein